MIYAFLIAGMLSSSKQYNITVLVLTGTIFDFVEINLLFSFLNLILVQ